MTTGLSKALLLVGVVLAGCQVPEAQEAHIGTPVPVAEAIYRTMLSEDLNCSAVDVGEGRVLTARHCTDNKATKVTDIGTLSYTGKAADFAVYTAGPRYTDLACRRVAEIGEHVYAVGFPGQPGTDDQLLTVTDGVIAGPIDAEGEQRFTAPIWFGSSGGGVWDDWGCLVGISVSLWNDRAGAYYMVPQATIWDELTDA